MSSIRTAILTISLLLVALVGYIFLTFDNGYQLEKAYEAFAKGEYDEAEGILGKILLEKSQLSLYQGYIERARGQLLASNTKFEQATGFEAAWNKAINGYLLHDHTKVETAIKELDGNNLWIPLLQSLKTPKKIFSVEEVHALPTSSSWMKKQVKLTFTPFWEATTLARLEMSKGCFVQARQHLESAQKNANDLQRDELDLLLATSYIKESEQKQEDVVIAYYKLALPHLSRLPLDHQRFDTARKEFSEKYKNEGVRIVKRGVYSDLPFFGYALDKFREDEGYKALLKEIHSHIDWLVERHDAAQLDQLKHVLTRMPSVELQEEIEALVQRAEIIENTDVINLMHLIILVDLIECPF